MKARHWILYSAALLLLALAFSYPLVRHLKEAMPYSFMPVKGREIVHQHPGDYIQLFYRFWLFGQALTGKIPFLSNPYEFSTPGTPPLFTTQGLPLSLVFLLFSAWGNIFAYNALILLSFIAAGAAIALLINELTGSRAAGIACGALYACLPYRLGHLYGGHPGGFIFFLTPLSLYCFERAWKKSESGDPKKALLWGFASGACVFFTSLTDLHTVFYLGIFLTAYVLMKFVDSAMRRGIPETFRTAYHPAFGLAVAALAAIAYLFWVKYFFLGKTIVGKGRPIETVKAFSPQLKDILCKNPNAERNVYLGIIPLLFGAYGFFVRRMEIRKGNAHAGALLWLYFWAVIFIISYVTALGTALDHYMPIYSWLHAHVPFLAYSRTPSRAITISAVCFFVLAAYGIRSLARGGNLAKALLIIALSLSFFDYHPGAFIGISLMRGRDSVYGEVKRSSRGGRLCELPLWPGDSAWSAIYEYYVTLTGVPMINGYNPAVQLSYVKKVFIPLRNLNLGEMREEQYNTLSRWDVRHLVLHQEAFPRKVSRYPFRLTLLKLLRSPFLEFTRRDGPHYLFKLREKRAGEKQLDLAISSPIGNLYPSTKMLHDIGDLVNDGAASCGHALCASSSSGATGWLWRGHSRIYPTGAFKVYFNLKTDSIKGAGPIARIEVYAPEEGKVIAEKEICPRDFAKAHCYEMFEIGFRNSEPTRVEFRINYIGRGSLWADFAYIIFSEEKDPRCTYEAEDLFHIGSCVEDPLASDGLAVHIGKDEDLYMPMVDGPARIYPPGRYRVIYRLRAGGVEPGEVVRLEVSSHFGGCVAQRGLTDDRLAEPDRYGEYSLTFDIKKETPLSFRLRHFNRALLWLDRIDIVEEK